MLDTNYTILIGTDNERNNLSAIQSAFENAIFFNSSNICWTCKIIINRKRSHSSRSCRICQNVCGIKGTFCSTHLSIAKDCKCGCNCKTGLLSAAIRHGGWQTKYRTRRVFSSFTKDRLLPSRRNTTYQEDIDGENMSATFRARYKAPFVDAARGDGKSNGNLGGRWRARVTICVCIKHQPAEVHINIYFYKMNIPGEIYITSWREVSAQRWRMRR